MQLRLRLWHLNLIMVALCVVVVASLLYWRSRLDAPVSELMRRLPEGSRAVVYIDVAALRDSGLLDLIAGAGSGEESNYRDFVRESGFNYRNDLDAVLASFHRGETFLILRGHFDWHRLNRYVERRHGSTYNGFCRVAGSRPDRRISFFAITPSIMALASGKDPWAAMALHRKGPPVGPGDVPDAPFWVRIDGSSLAGAAWLPAGSRSFASLLSNAEQIIFRVKSGKPDFEAQLEARCATPEDAAKLAGRLQTVTAVLRKLVGPEGKAPNKRDLGGVLTSGRFKQEGSRVLGRWSVSLEFLQNLVSAPDQSAAGAGYSPAH